MPRPARSEAVDTIKAQGLPIAPKSREPPIFWVPSPKIPPIGDTRATPLSPSPLGRGPGGCAPDPISVSKCFEKKKHRENGSRSVARTEILLIFQSKAPN